jgi:alpha-beta hydrolase superfamily lysophospholipase
VDHTTRLLTTRDQTRIHVESWAPAGPPRFVVCIAHGGAEHIGRYDRLARWFGERGGFVFGPDHRGQGLSGGPPGHVEHFSVYANDLAEVVTQQQDVLPPSARPDAIPWFLFGHSMGGLISLTYLLDQAGRHPFAGAIISAPLLGLTMKVPPLKLKIGQIAARIAPRLTLPSGIPASAISRDPAEVDTYTRDRRRIDKISARWFAAMNAAVTRVTADAHKLEIPMLWYVGTGDLICDPNATRRVFDTLSQPAIRSQTLRTFDGYYHELHNEPELLRQPIKELLLGWIEPRLQPLAA